jgi:elongation factor G
MAGSLALKNAVAKAGPILLEPVMKLEVVTPEQFLGDIIGDLNSRRGHLLAIEARGSTTLVKAIVPLGETFGYATVIRSLTQGRATYSMEFNAYQEVPAVLVEQIFKGDR